MPAKWTVELGQILVPSFQLSNLSFVLVAFEPVRHMTLKTFLNPHRPKGFPRLLDIVLPQDPRTVFDLVRESHPTQRSTKALSLAKPPPPTT